MSLDLRLPDSQMRPDLSQAEQHDLLMMLVSLDWHVPTQEGGIDARWLDAFLALRIADVLAKRHFGKPLMELAAKDRASLRDYAESCVEDAAGIFGVPEGDAEYRPQDEPEWDSERAL